MDPVECLARFDNGLIARDKEAVAEAADALIGWIEKGGFLPSLEGWRTYFNRQQFLGYLRDIRHVAEMV